MGGNAFDASFCGLAQMSAEKSTLPRDFVSPPKDARGFPTSKTSFDSNNDGGAGTKKRLIMNVKNAKGTMMLRENSGATVDTEDSTTVDGFTVNTGSSENKVNALKLRIGSSTQNKNTTISLKPRLRMEVGGPKTPSAAAKTQVRTMHKKGNTMDLSGHLESSRQPTASKRTGGSGSSVISRKSAADIVAERRRQPIQRVAMDTEDDSETAAPAATSTAASASIPTMFQYALATTPKTNKLSYRTRKGMSDGESSPAPSHVPESASSSDVKSTSQTTTPSEEKAVNSSRETRTRGSSNRDRSKRSSSNGRLATSSSAPTTPRPTSSKERTSSRPPRSSRRETSLRTPRSSSKGTSPVRTPRSSRKGTSPVRTPRSSSKGSSPVSTPRSSSKGTSPSSTSRSSSDELLRRWSRRSDKATEKSEGSCAAPVFSPLLTETLIGSQDDRAQRYCSTTSDTPNDATEYDENQQLVESTTTQTEQKTTKEESSNKPPDLCSPKKLENSEMKRSTSNDDRRRKEKDTLSTISTTTTTEAKSNKEEVGNDKIDSTNTRRRPSAWELRERHKHDKPKTVSSDSTRSHSQRLPIPGDSSITNSPAELSIARTSHRSKDPSTASKSTRRRYGTSNSASDQNLPPAFRTIQAADPSTKISSTGSTGPSTSPVSKISRRRCARRSGSDQNLPPNQATPRAPADRLTTMPSNDSTDPSVSPASKSVRRRYDSGCDQNSPPTFGTTQDTSKIADDASTTTPSPSSEVPSVSPASKPERRRCGSHSVCDQNSPPTFQATARTTADLLTTKSATDSTVPSASPKSKSPRRRYGSQNGGDQNLPPAFRSAQTTTSRAHADPLTTKSSTVSTAPAAAPSSKPARRRCASLNSSDQNLPHASRTIQATSTSPSDPPITMSTMESTVPSASPSSKPPVARRRYGSQCTSDENLPPAFRSIQRSSNTLSSPRAPATNPTHFENNNIRGGCSRVNDGLSSPATRRQSNPERSRMAETSNERQKSRLASLGSFGLDMDANTAAAIANTPMKIENMNGKTRLVVELGELPPALRQMVMSKD